MDVAQATIAASRLSEAELAPLAAFGPHLVLVSAAIETITDPTDPSFAAAPDEAFPHSRRARSRIRASATAAP